MAQDVKAPKDSHGRVPPDPDELSPHFRARREGIVTAAVRLLEGSEYEDVQVREVAEEAGVAIGTVYRYFRSKEHLYAAALLEWGKSFEPSSGRDMVGTSDEERIRNLLARAVTAFERRPQMLRAEIALVGTNDPSARILFDEFAYRNVRVMLDSLRDVAPADGTAIVETLNASLSVQLTSWALGRRTLTEVRRSLDRSVDLLFHGVTD